MMKYFHKINESNESSQTSNSYAHSLNKVISLVPKGVLTKRYSHFDIDDNKQKVFLLYNIVNLRISTSSRCSSDGKSLCGV